MCVYESCMNVIRQQSAVKSVRGHVVWCVCLMVLQRLKMIDGHPQQNLKPDKSKKPAGTTVGGLDIEQHTSQVSGIMSASTFDSLQLSRPTAQGITDMTFTHMTEVQVCEVSRNWAGAAFIQAVLPMYVWEAPQK